MFVVVFPNFSNFKLTHQSFSEVKDAFTISYWITRGILKIHFGAYTLKSTSSVYRELFGVYVREYGQRLPSKLQVEGSFVGENSMCSSVKAGEHLESLSSSSVQEEPHYEAIGQVSNGERGLLGVITDRESMDIVVWFVETRWMHRLPHLWAEIIVGFSHGYLVGDVGWGQGGWCARA